MQSLRNGTQLGDYIIVGLIARGGMGEVYEAYDIKLDRRVAVKVIAPDNPAEHDSDDLVRRFMQEARILAKVNHPNVVTIHAIESRTKTPFIAMEIVEGVALRTLLKRFTFSAEMVAVLFEQILSGVKCLHDNNIVHRDLKPLNILLRSDGRIKILDLGIAKAVGDGENTKPGLVVGSPQYMAPELRKGIRGSVRSDLWSLGAILFEFLAGRRLIEAIQGEELQFSINDLSLIPTDMRAMISGMCAPTPDDRYANAAEVFADLQRFRVSAPRVKAEEWAALEKKIEKLRRPRLKFTPPPIVEPEVAPPAPKVQKENLPRTTGSGNKNLGRRETDPSPKIPLRWLAMGASAALLIILPLAFFMRGKEPAKALPPPRAPASPVVVQLTEPADHQLLWLKAKQIPTLYWSRSVTPGEYDIQIAADEHFEKVIIQEPVTGRSFRPSLWLEEAQYFWRLSAHTAGASASPAVKARSFSLIFPQPVKLLKPDAGEAMEFAAKSSAAVDFKWACKPDVLGYVLQMARDAKFRDLAIGSSVTGCAWQGAKVSPGHYFWRVRVARAPVTHQIWSEARPLTIKLAPEPKAKASQPIELAAPRIKSPAQTIVLKFRKKPRDLASIGSSVAEVPTLAWLPVTGAQHYLVQVATSRDFNTLLLEESTTRNRLAWKTLVAGRAFWRVSAVRLGGERGKFSGPAEIRILLPAPHLQSIYKFYVPTNRNGPLNQAVLEWAPSVVASNYVVQVGKRRDLAGVEERTLDAPKISFENGSRQWFVRVAVADDAGAAISRYSTVASVEIETIYKLEKPRLLGPNNGARAPSKNGHISIEFSWGQVAQAETYVLEVASDAGFTQILTRRNIDKVKILLEQTDFAGRVFWRVQAQAKGKSSDWSDPAFIDIK